MGEGSTRGQSKALGRTQGTDMMISAWETGDSVPETFDIKLGFSGQVDVGPVKKRVRTSCEHE